MPGHLDTVYPGDDSAVVSHYIPGYPPLQPSPVTGIQPSTIGEEMVYPASSPPEMYSTNASSNIDMGPGAHSQPLVTNQEHGSQAIAVNYTSGLGAEGYNQNNQLSYCSDYGPPPTSQNHSSDGGGLCLQGGPVSYGHFRHEKTTPAKRGKFKDDAQRLGTARTRKLGSCIRCRMQRIRVSQVLKRSLDGPLISYQMPG